MQQLELKFNLFFRQCHDGLLRVVHPQFWFDQSCHNGEYFLIFPLALHRILFISILLFARPHTNSVVMSFCGNLAIYIKFTRFLGYYGENLWWTSMVAEFIYILGRERRSPSFHWPANTIWVECNFKLIPFNFGIFSWDCFGHYFKTCYVLSETLVLFTTQE